MSARLDTRDETCPRGGYWTCNGARFYEFVPAPAGCTDIAGLWMISEYATAPTGGDMPASRPVPSITHHGRGGGREASDPHVVRMAQNRANDRATWHDRARDHGRRR